MPLSRKRKAPARTRRGVAHQVKAYLANRTFALSMAQTACRENPDRLPLRERTRRERAAATITAELSATDASPLTSHL